MPLRKLSVGPALLTSAASLVLLLASGCLPGTSGSDFYGDGGPPATDDSAGAGGSGGSGGSARPPRDGGPDAEPDGSIAPDDDAGPPGPCEPGKSETGTCGKCGSRVRICSSSGSWSEWSKCSGESGVCTPRQTRTSACGTRCGTRTETCTASCGWAGGTCSEGACSPGTKDTSSAGCSAGETKERTCSGTCTWGPFGPCTSGACTPGDTENETCGKCGTRMRSCTGSGTWGAWGPCGAEAGECTPGEGRTAPCGKCGTRMDTCSASCGWTTGICTGEGVCASGDVDTTTIGCLAGATRSRTCGAFCSWGAYGPCSVTPPTRACSDGSAGEALGTKMIGCPGKVSWPNRDSLCGTGWSTCTAAQWVSRRTGVPGYHYWVDEELKGGGVERKCYASILRSGFGCPVGNPMRVCTTTKTDPKGNTCIWINCGFETTSPNQYFGGCNSDTRSAGTLCCAE